MASHALCSPVLRERKKKVKRVLVLCTGNSCRSQMAQAIWQDLGQGDWESYSAGSKPSGYVHPLAIEAAAEIGLDISAYESKSLEQYLGEPMDVVVTVCDNAKESCPVFPGAGQVLHWPFDDPADATGDHEQQMQVFRRVRDEIREKIGSYLS
jgi:arsenate reductase